MLGMIHLEIGSLGTANVWQKKKDLLNSFECAHGLTKDGVIREQKPTSFNQ